MSNVSAVPRHHDRRSSRARVAVAALAVAVLAAVGLAVATPAQALTGDIRMHDPSVIKVGACYYGFSTGFENDPLNPKGSITERKTCSGTAASGWTKVGNVWSSTPAWIGQRLGQTPPNIWAPDIKFFNNKYYLYYSGAIWGTAGAVMGVATATNIEGPWTDQGMVTDVNTPIRLYVTWGSFSDGIFMHVLDAATGKLSTTDNNLWKLASGMEGTTIVLNGGYYYLFGSKGTCCAGVNSTYYTVVGRSTSITGPYTDASGAALTSGGGTRVMGGVYPRVGAGGADAYDDGSAKFLAYHYYDANNSGRETLDIRQVTFSGGWPVFAAPLGTASNTLANKNSGMCADVWALSTADGAAVDQGSCNAGANQQWVFKPTGSNFQLVNVNSGKCLEVPASSTTSGAVVGQWSCNGGSNQLWARTPTIGAYVTLKNAHSGQCLEVYGNSTANGAAMNQYPCNGGANQQWLVD
jgi:arabinan endo-1,5-alpha-L-arabinosidase